MVDPAGPVAGSEGPKYFPRMRVPGSAVTHLGTVQRIQVARAGYLWRPLCGAEGIDLVKLDAEGARAEIRDGAEVLIDADGTTRALAWCPQCHSYVRAVQAGRRDTAD